MGRLNRQYLLLATLLFHAATQRSRKMRKFIRNKKKGYFKTSYNRLRRYPVEFEKMTRMFPEDFDFIVETLGDRLKTNSNNTCMSPHERLFITL